MKIVDSLIYLSESLFKPLGNQEIKNVWVKARAEKVKGVSGLVMTRSIEPYLIETASHVYSIEKDSFDLAPGFSVDSFIRVIMPYMNPYPLKYTIYEGPRDICEKIKNEVTEKIYSALRQHPFNSKRVMGLLVHDHQVVFSTNRQKSNILPSLIGKT